MQVSKIFKKQLIILKIIGKNFKFDIFAFSEYSLVVSIFKFIWRK